MSESLQKKSAIEYYKNTDQEVLQYHMQYLNKNILQKLLQYWRLCCNKYCNTSNTAIL